MRNFNSGVLVACSAFLLWVGSAGATDIRVALTTVPTTYAGTPVQFQKGGRVGNWLGGSGNVIVLDGNITPFSPLHTYLTNIFTMPAGGGALNLISAASGPNTWQPGDGVVGDTPHYGSYYLGNPWFCPGTLRVSN